jgi:ribonuclease Z
LAAEGINMKITFLGTSHGYPEKNRMCSSAMIETGGAIYLIDAGGHVAKRIIDIDRNPENIRAVFVTHTHSDHVTGLMDLAGVVSNPKIYPKSEIDYYLPEENAYRVVKHYFETIRGPLREEINRFHIYTESFVYKDENIKVTPFKTGHLKKQNRPAFGFIVECEGKTVCFSGDLSYKLEYNDFPKIALEKSIDLLVCEMAHFDFEILRPHIEKCRTKRLYFNHIKFPNERIPLLEEENKSGRFPFSIYAPSDGDFIEL